MPYIPKKTIEVIARQWLHRGVEKQPKAFARRLDETS
jgi:hypothetical protein